MESVCEREGRPIDRKRDIERQTDREIIMECVYVCESICYQCYISKSKL